MSITREAENMGYKLRLEEAERLYELVCTAYDPKYPDTPDERKIAVNFLEGTLKRMSFHHENLAKKARQMSDEHGGIKTKVSTSIMQKFWERRFTEHIPYNKFDPDKE